MGGTDLLDMSVLVVSDDMAQATHMERMLRAGSFTCVRQVTEPALLQEVVRNHAPDLILLDLHLRGADGLHVLSDLERSDTAAVSVPIIAVTSDRAPTTVRRALNYGAVDFLVTPVDPAELALRVRNQLRMRQMALALDERRRAEHDGAEASINAARQLLHEIMYRSGAAIYILDTDGCYTMANPAYGEIVGLDPEAIVGQPRAAVVPPELRATVLASDARVFEGETVTEELTDATGRATSVIKFALTDPTGERYGLCGIGTDVTEISRMRVQIEHLSAFDPLTGLYNRKRLLESLDTWLRRPPALGAAERRSQGALLLLDVDHFKAVNDSLGHGAGDDRLRHVADILRGRMRESDLVGRVSGDEFAVVLWGDDEDAALKIAAEIQALLRTDPSAPIHVSIGVSTFVEGEQLEAEDLLIAADVALQEAKDAGGDGVCVYRWHSAGGSIWLRRIRAALDDCQFELHAQPILDLRSNRVCLHELLIRMRTEDGDLIPPAAFIPTAEKFGLIGEIDHWVLSRGLELAASGQRVAINLSAHSLIHAQDTILRVLRGATDEGTDLANVILEITETAALGNLALAGMFTSELAEIGCSVALDDFGTGFGSFSHLKHLPVSYIKVDMEFVRQAVVSRVDREIVRSIAQIGATLGKHTIAEGVEDAETLDLLRDLGVDFVQGYHIGRPLPITAAFAPTATDAR